MKTFFKDKNILVCVTGGIACYKTVNIVSFLRKAGANVKVIMTEHSTEFVTPLTFSSVGNCDVYTSMFDYKTRDINHISLKDFPDFTIVAPASANIIGKFTSTIADDLLSTTLLGIKTPVIFVPAMNTDMFENIFFQKKLDLLKNNGYMVMEPESGNLACGVIGKGRMPEPEQILEYIFNKFNKKKFSGKKVLITLGSTREYFDSVRFLSNASSGKMGLEIAKAFYREGADVTAVCGPNTVQIPDYIKKIDVVSAMEMYEKTSAVFENSDIFVGTAAVCDFRPANKINGKLKKEHNSLNDIKFEKNPDIIKNLSKEKNKGQIVVGFAAETDNIKKNAQKKLKEKNLDLIVLNDVSRNDIGFGSDNNEVYLITSKNEIFLNKCSKKIIAEKIVDTILNI